MDVCRCYCWKFLVWLPQDKSSNSNLKIEALVFTRLVMASHSSGVFHPHIKVCAWEAHEIISPIVRICCPCLTTEVLIFLLTVFGIFHGYFFLFFFFPEFQEIYCLFWGTLLSRIFVRRWSFYPVANSNLLSIQALSAPVLAAVGERYYKVTAEALRVCGELVKAIRPNFDNVRISC